MCMHLRNAEKLKENAISETVCRISLSVKAEYCCLRMFLLIYYRCCRVGNWLLLVRFSSACAGTSPVRWISKLFFSFYFKCPLASNICAGCNVERSRRKKEKKQSTNCPHSWTAPLSLFLSSAGSFPHKCLAKQKRCCCFCMQNKSLIY